MENIYKELQKLGFSQYECKAYIGLLQNAPITGYEISKRTGVPRSMIYEVLGKLLDKGAIFTVPSEPIKYTPLPARELIDRMRKSFDQSFDYLEKHLTALKSEQEVDVIWRINSDERVIAEMVDIVERAADEVWLSVWEPQVPFIQEAIAKRINTGVTVSTVLFGAPEIRLGETYHHNYMSPDVARNRMGGQLTIVVRDGEEVLIANFAGNASAWAVRTVDPALVLVATEYIRHDIMIGEVTKELGADKVDALWRNNRGLSHVVTGRCPV